MNFESYSIEGTHILYQGELISGWICIRNGIIDSIVAKGQEDHIDFEQFPTKYHFENQVIMAGAIDVSISIHAAYNNQRSLHTKFQNIFLIRGTTLILNKPFGNYERGSEESIEEFQESMYLSQVEDLQQHSYIDFIQSTFINLETLSHVTKMNQLGAAVFYGCLSKSQCKEIQPIASHSDLIEIVANLPGRLVLHMQSCCDKDLNASTPFRASSQRQRLEQPIPAFTTYDGIAGQINSDEECSPGSSEDAFVNDQISNDSVLSQDCFAISPPMDKDLYLRTSKYIAKRQQHQLISHAELRSYSNSKQGSKPPSLVNILNEETKDQGDEYKFPMSPHSLHSETQTDCFDCNTHSKTEHKSSSETSECQEVKNRTRSLSNSLLLQRRQKRPQSRFALSLLEVKGDEEVVQERMDHNRDYLCFLAFRPDFWEKNAVQLLEKCLKQVTPRWSMLLTGFSSSMSAARMAKLSSPWVFTELSYPYQFIDSGLVGEGQTQYKTDPPFRSSENRRMIQQAIATGSLIDCVGSSSAPVDPKLKCRNTGDFRRAYSGAASEGMQYQATWTTIWNRASKRLNLASSDAWATLQSPDSPKRTRLVAQLCKLQQLVSSNPAKFLGIEDQYGYLKAKAVANLVVWDPFKPTTTEYLDQDMHVLGNQSFLGQIDFVFLRGNLILERNEQQKPVLTKIAAHNVELFQPSEFKL